MLKTGINFHDQGYHTDHETTMRLIREAGFDCIFSGWTDDINVTDQICNLAAKYGVAYEAVHAPFGGISHIWEDNEQGAVWVDRLKHIADICQRFGIGYMTIHVTECKQFNPRYFPSRVTAIGVQRYAEIIEYAAERGVKAAIENTEFPSS